MPDLTDFDFATLRRANIARLPQFRNSKGGPAHSEPDGSDWLLSAWSNATLSELGEAAEVLVGMRTASLTATLTQLAHEVSDVIIYLDIYAMRCGVTLSPPTEDRMYSAFNFISRAYTPDGVLAPEIVLAAAQAALGKAGNLVKKIERGDTSLEIAADELSALFTSGLCYLQLLADGMSLDLATAIVEKFNIVSERVGSDVFINEDGRGLRYLG